MQQLKTELPEVIVSGYKDVARAVINDTRTSATEEDEENDEEKKDRFHMLVEGYGLLDVMGCEGVDATRTSSNHVIEIEQVLGVEAARRKIQTEIKGIMEPYGIGIDSRHLQLLSDVMTYKGEVLGITRFGVSKMRDR